MTKPGRLLLAFDFGIRRIGIATGNLLTRTASPLTTLTSRGSPPWNEIDSIIAEWQPDMIVVGHPGDEADSRLLKSLQSFVEELDQRYGLASELVDESYTSTAAEETLRAGRGEGIYNRRLDKGRIDQHAACLIAEQWMNQTFD